jgi:hypothetical protein
VALATLQLLAEQNQEFAPRRTSTSAHSKNSTCAGAVMPCAGNGAVIAQCSLTTAASVDPIVGWERPTVQLAASHRDAGSCQHLAGAREGRRLRQTGDSGGAVRAPESSAASDRHGVRARPCQVVGSIALLAYSVRTEYGIYAVCRQLARTHDFS